MKTFLCGAVVAVVVVTLWRRHQRWIHEFDNQEVGHE